MRFSPKRQISYEVVDFKEVKPIMSELPTEGEPTSLNPFSSNF